MHGCIFTYDNNAIWISLIILIFCESCEHVRVPFSFTYVFLTAVAVALGLLLAKSWDTCGCMILECRLVSNAACDSNLLSSP